MTELGILIAAARMIRDRGWCQRAADEPAIGRAEILLESAVGTHVPRWNDAADQTRNGVLTGFDRAIAAAEG